jgi:hypothetical protein
MSWGYECIDGFVRPLSECYLAWDPTGRYWYLPNGRELPAGWRRG